ncbi:hypothetical protein LJR009_001597 [Bosea sp. LjRoot9]|uniref:hypothetical protein n=1 Tax=Bosea sp. LjRoot9 TaxID=3342341 RepID=UPI003ECC30B4
MSLIKTVILADPEARVPWPGVPGRLLPAEPFDVSIVDAFFSALIADKTLIEPPAEPAPPAKETKTKA